MALWDKLFKKRDESPSRLNPIVQKNSSPAAPPRVSAARPAPRPASVGSGPASGPAAAGPPEPEKSATRVRQAERDTKKRKNKAEGGTKARAHLTDDQALVKRGLLRQSQGDHDGAIQDFTQAIEINPDCAQAYASRGVSLEAKGDGGGAKSDYSKSIQIEIMSEINRQIRENPEVEM